MTRDSSAELFVNPQLYTKSNQFPDGRSLKIYDTTLRDGEQMPGVAMSPEQKYTIAKELSSIGCHIIDMGFPASAPSEQTALQMVLRGKHRGEIREDLEVLVMCRASEHDINSTIRALESQGLSTRDVTFLIFTASSPLHCKYKLGSTLLRREGVSERDNPPLEFFHEANKRMVLDVIRYARSKGIRNIEFGAEDASRTAIPQLIDLVQVALDAGAKRYVFADTTGSLSPEATGIYCSQLTKAFPNTERASHFHNDFDLATINVLTSIQNGFNIFSTTVNGIGERAGNARLHSVVACLKYIYGVEIPGFEYDRLWRIKSIVEKITGIPVQPQEPIIGFNVYTHESGIHAHGISIDRAMYEPLPYKEVGGVSRYVYGKHSGTHCIAEVLQRHAVEFCCPIDDEFVLSVTKDVKALRESWAAEDRVAAHIAEYYRNLDSLGVSEDDLVELAKNIAITRYSRSVPIAQLG